MSVKVISIGYAVPEHKVTQDEAFEILGYPPHFKPIFMKSGINQRYFCVPLSEAKSLSFQRQQELYRQYSLQYSLEAIKSCMDGRDYNNIGCLIYDSCTGFAPGPTMAHYLAQSLNIPKDSYLANISSHGCEGGFPGLKRALDFVLNSNRQALVVNCELSSLAYFPEPLIDPTNDFELLRSAAIFADAAVSVLVGREEKTWRHPTILGTETYLETAYINDLGFIWQDGRLRVRLSKKVPEYAPKVVKPAVERLLKRYRLEIGDISWWVIHAAGATVLDNVRDGLGIPEEKMALSRQTLRDFGNTSSTSVGITGKRLMSERIQYGDYAMMLSIGPGMVGGSTLFRYA